MGEAADRVVSEIEQTRAQIERDLAELETRLPGRIRSTRTAVGAVVGASTVAGIGSWLLRQRRDEPGGQGALHRGRRAHRHGAACPRRRLRDRTSPVRESDGRLDTLCAAAEVASGRAGAFAHERARTVEAELNTEVRTTRSHRLGA